MALAPAAESAAPPNDRGPGTDTRRVDRRMLLLLACCALALPFVVLFVRATMSSWVAVADNAAIELRTRAVGTSDTPLVGVYSRYDWSHPGPLLFYVLAVPYRLLGSPSFGLLAAAVLINLGWVVLSAWMLWRRGGVAGLVLGSIPLALLLHALGGTFLQQPWNPYIVVLALFALALVVWSIACGDHWLLPVAIAVATFAVQSHVGTAVPAFGLGAVALMFLAVDLRRGHVRRPARLGIVSVAVAFVLWLPPIIQELAGGRGNLTELWSFWTSKQGPTPGFATGARLIASQLGVTPPFLTGHEKLNVFTAGIDTSGGIPLALILLVAAAVIAFVRRDRTSFTLDVVALVVVASAWVSAARVVGEPLFYVLRWTWIVGALAWLAIGWTAVRAARAFVPSARTTAAGVAIAALAVAVLVWMVAATTVAAVRADPPDAVASDLLRRVDGRVHDALAQRDGTVLVHAAGGFRAAIFARGLELRLARSGVDAGLDRSDEHVVGSRYVVPRTHASTEIVVASDDDEIVRYAQDPRYREIARADTLTRAERDEFAALNAQIAANRADLRTWVTEHPDAWQRSRDLSQRAQRVVVFERA